ncbi:GNAT family N-acetyltransferase [Candidatus Clostridium stratigraminis]|uniref:GNAT family N-acetyltransferase n=1 Tax=Candidatus Clostridium stratigraminis TaxID=3381661 RepID=A0ABW8T4J8_9CLOT
MKDKAIAYLMKNPLLHIGMLEPIRRGTVDILYAETDGVLIKEQKSKAYMISVNNFEKGRELINCIEKCNLILAHQNFMVNYILNKFGLTKKLECIQAVYMDKYKLNVKEELEIRQLEQDQREVILEHYDKLSNNEIDEILKNGNLFGGYWNEILIGFIGNHLEGSMGLLEVFPTYRRLGYGTLLESYLVNQMLDKDLIPFAQIEIDNDKSKALHNKLGFTISQDSVYWVF